MLESYGIRDCRSAKTLKPYVSHFGLLIHSSANLSHYGKIFLILCCFNTSSILRYRNILHIIFCVRVTQFFLKKILRIVLYYFCNTCPFTDEITRQRASRRDGERINFIIQNRCLRLSGAIDRAGRARDSPYARTVALICNTCGSSELPMREDEWCVRMRLRPDCGGVFRK